MTMSRGTLQSQLVNVSRYTKRVTFRTVTQELVRGRSDVSHSDRVVWADVTQLAGRERDENGVLTAPQDRLVVWCHWASRPGEKDRVIYNDRYYRIVGIAEIGRRLEARIDCDLISAGGQP